MALSPAARAIRKRLYEDFEYYAEKCLKIRTKAQKIEALRLNEAQKRLVDLICQQLADTGYVRIIILKGRQMGLSTVVGGFLYWWVSQRRAQKAMVVAHKAESTQTLFDMTRRFHDKVPDAVKPSTRYSSRKELVFDKLDSSYTVVTAGGDSIGRSETITAAHLSELAFWPPGVAKENFSGLMDTIPNTPGTVVFIESTANGVSGVFFDQWQAATRGEGMFVPIFLPWFIDPGYRIKAPKDFTPTPDEAALIAAYGLDHEQLMYRRARIAEKGLDLFKQEYPCNAEEAFLTSGRPVFVPEQITDWLNRSPDHPGGAGKPIGWVPDRPPPERFALEDGMWQPHSRGPLKVYIPHDPAATYFIGADVGAGVSKDYSVAQVIDTAGRQVAVFRDQADPDYFATILEALGFHFNNARIIVESNNHGILTCTRLGKDLAYPNFFTETVYDKLSDKETIKLGFTTSVKSKPLVIDKLRAALREGKARVYDRTTLEEMRAYIVTETGKMEAEKGGHDDTVMALALANHINEGEFVPIQNQDDWFVQTI